MLHLSINEKCSKIFIKYPMHPIMFYLTKTDVCGSVIIYS